MFRPLPLMVACGLLAPVFAQEPMPWSLRSEATEIRLPEGERLGLVGIAALGESTQGFFLGPMLLGALRGERGGLFVVGLEGGARIPVTSAWSLEGALFMGGGGGRNAPVGGGFLVRPRVGLAWQQGNNRLGVSFTHYRFPGGPISSHQFGLQWEHTFRSWLPLEVGGNSSRDTGIGFPSTAHREFLEIRGTRQWLDTGPPMDRIGLCWGHFLGERVFLQVESSGAARGRNAGYMDLLGGLGARFFLDDARFLSVRGAITAGSGGGGAVDTGGGFLLKGSATLQFQVTPSVHLLVEGGRLWAPSGGFRGTTVSVGAGITLDVGAARRESREPSDWSLQEWRLAAGFQHWNSAARRAGAQPASLEQLVLKVEVPLSDTLFASGQTGWATGGGAGAWATGMLGMGIQTPSWKGHRLRADLSVGAGGGGGVESRGGALVQGMAGWTWDFAPNWYTHLLGGRIQSLQKGFSTPVIEAGLGFRGFLRVRVPRHR